MNLKVLCIVNNDCDLNDCFDKSGNMFNDRDTNLDLHNWTHGNCFFVNIFDDYNILLFVCLPFYNNNW